MDAESARPSLEQSTFRRRHTRNELCTRLHKQWRCSHVMPNGNSPGLTNTFGRSGACSKPNGSATVTVLTISSGLGGEQTGNKEMAISHLASYLFGRDKAVRRASAFVSCSVSAVSQRRTATVRRLICTPRSITELARAAVGSGAGEVQRWEGAKTTHR